MLPKEKKYFEVPPDWVYRGEGNCNVVLSLPKTKKILRLRKSDQSKTIIGWLITWISDLLFWYLGKGLKDEIRDLKFYLKIMRPLFGSNYVSDAEQVVISRTQIKQLEKELYKHRPDFRKSKSLHTRRATLFDDFAFLPEDYIPFKLANDTFAIEIKPKQGWTPYSEKCFPKCMFCMNQYNKIRENQIKSISKYCPEDLFSGERDRMNIAIKALIETPQNNFRIFKNGNLVYGESTTAKFEKILHQFFASNERVDSLHHEFCELIQKSLTTDITCMTKKNICKEKLFCEWNKIIQDSYRNYKLPKDCVLEKILSVQMLDAEGSEYYNKLLGNETFKDWSYVKRLLKEVEQNKNERCLNCLIMMLCNTEHVDVKNDLVFAAYLISAVAKDCSLMLTFRKIEDDSDDMGISNIIKTKHGCFILNIGVFDLYPKPLSTIRKHVKRNKTVLETYLKAEVSKHIF